MIPRALGGRVRATLKCKAQGNLIVWRKHSAYTDG